MQLLLLLRILTCTFNMHQLFPAAKIQLNEQKNNSNVNISNFQALRVDETLPQTAGLALFFHMRLVKPYSHYTN